MKAGLSIPAIFSIALSMSSSSDAADKSGKYSVKGAGLQRCSTFQTAWETGSPDLALYGGWIEGYITALNRLVPETFDYFPWQTTETLLAFVQATCAQLPTDTSFEVAFGRFIEASGSLVLTEESGVTGLRTPEKTAFVYQAVLRAAQHALSKRGYDDVGELGQFDTRLSETLKTFQKDHDIPISGLPDQKTLFFLLQSN